MEYMNMNYFVDNAKVMPKGQITIPKDIRDLLRIGVGDRVAFVCENDKVFLVNSSLYAMRVLQNQMKDEGKKVGLKTEEDVNEMISKMRRGKEF